MKPKKIFKFKKGEIVYCSAFVFTQYEKNYYPTHSTMKVIHTPEGKQHNKKVLVRNEVGLGWIHPFLVVGIKQIQTGYYDAASNWGDEPEPPMFTPDKFHDVYVLESMQSQRWSKLDYALEADLRSEK